MRLGRADLGIGVRQRQHQRIAGHRPHHVGIDQARRRNPQKDIGAGHCLADRSKVGLCRIARLVRLHRLVAALVNDAATVGDDDRVGPKAHSGKQVEAGDGRRAGARADEAHVLQPTPGQFEPVDQGGRRDHGGAVLVVVKDRDVHALDQLALDLETLRRLDVLQVDAAEGGLEPRDGVHEGVHAGLRDLDVEHVDPGETLEQDRLAFHHRLGRERTDVAEAEHRGAVADHADPVRASGHFGGGRRVVDDGETGVGHAGGIGKRQIVGGRYRLGRDHLQLPRGIGAVIGERPLLERHSHNFPDGRRRRHSMSERRSWRAPGGLGRARTLV